MKAKVWPKNLQNFRQKLFKWLLKQCESSFSSIKSKVVTQQTFVGLYDVFKTSSGHVLKTSSTCLQRNNFWSFKTSWKRLEDVLEDEKLLRWRRLQDVFKTCLQDIFKTSWKKKWGYLYLKNLNGYVSNKSIFHKSVPAESKANPKSLIRTQWFQWFSRMWDTLISGSSKFVNQLYTGDLAPMQAIGVVGVFQN